MPVTYGLGGGWAGAFTPGLSAQRAYPKTDPLPSRQGRGLSDRQAGAILTPIEPHFMGGPTQTPGKAWGWGSPWTERQSARCSWDLRGPGWCFLGLGTPSDPAWRAQPRGELAPRPTCRRTEPTAESVLARPRSGGDDSPWTARGAVGRDASRSLSLPRLQTTDLSRSLHPEEANPPSHAIIEKKLKFQYASYCGREVRPRARRRLSGTLLHQLCRLGPRFIHRLVERPGGPSTAVGTVHCHGDRFGASTYRRCFQRRR